MRPGCWGRCCSEWTNIENLVVTDSEYRYTIDEHTLLAAERAAELRGTRDPARQRFGQLLSEIDHPALLLFALLFHDMGKNPASDDPLALAVARAGEAMSTCRDAGQKNKVRLNFLSSISSICRR